VEFSAHWRARVLDQSIHAAQELSPSATPMEVLRTAVSALSMYDADEADNLHDANVRKSFRLTSQIAMIVAIYDRLRKGWPWSSRTQVADPRGQFPVDAERRKALRDGDQDAGCGADPACRP
jgi:citrate synthase